MNTIAILVSGWLAAAAGQAPASRPVVSPTPGRPLNTLIEAELRTDRPRYPVNAPIQLELVVRNLTADFVQIDVPLGTLDSKLPAGLPLTGMGLPLEHVFSGESFRALSVAIEGDPYLGDRVTHPPSRTIPGVTLSPFGEIGLKADATRFYPMLLREGRYELRWKPYGGAVQSNLLTIEVRAFKQVVLETDVGRLTFKMLYDKAPLTVENFIELASNHFYDSLTFFSVDPALAVQAGCPKNNGTGRRSDGKTILPEFNDTQFERGTVGMSLTISDKATDANSGSCQFFITLSRQAGLDRRFTAFAQIEGPDSMETLRKISELPRNSHGMPIKPVAIRSASVLNAPYSRTTASK